MTVAKSRIEKSAAAFRSIGEVGSELGLETHVLRYWEGKFPKHVKPVKRADGRRMFRPEDIEALRAIQILVHSRGLTLKGAKALLEEQGVGAVLSGDVRLGGALPDVEPTRPVPSPARQLQQSVEVAFSPAAPDAPVSKQDTIKPLSGSSEVLSAMLKDMTHLKQRLDAARARCVA